MRSFIEGREGKRELERQRGRQGEREIEGRQRERELPPQREGRKEKKRKEWAELVSYMFLCTLIKTRALGWTRCSLGRGQGRGA